MSNEIVAGHRSQHASASEVGTKRKRVKTLRREMIQKESKVASVEADSR